MIYSNFLILTVILFSSAAHAEENSRDGAHLEGTIRLDNDLLPDENGTIRENLRFQRVEIQGSYVTGPFSFVLRTRTEQNFIINGESDHNHLRLTDYIKEAYALYEQPGEIPYGIGVGANEVAFGQDYPGTIDYQNDASHEMTDPDQGQIKGLSFMLDTSKKSFIDKFETIFFAPDPEIRHASLNHFDGFAVRISKNFSKHFSFQTSLLRKDNSYSDELLPEAKESFGGVYSEKNWNTWIETVLMKYAEAYPNAHIGVTTGYQQILGQGRADFEFTSIENTLTQTALGYEYYFSRHWALAETFRYTDCKGGNAGCVAVRGYGQGPSYSTTLRYEFGESAAE